jgi:DNA-binding NarL/FixJ family response regulator
VSDVPVAPSSSTGQGGVPDDVRWRVVVVLADPGRATTVAGALERAGATSDVPPRPPGGAGPDPLVEQVAAALPDLAVLGTDLGDLLVGLVAALTERVPVVPLLVLAEHGDDAVVGRALLTGARAVAPADGDDAELVTAAERTAQGEAPLTAAAATSVLTAYRRLAEGSGARVGIPPLTPTEQEVLQRLAAGATPDQIAALHQVTPRMVLLPAAAAVRKLQRAYRDARLRGR